MAISTKKILFVINTLGGAGAEHAMVELLRTMAKDSGYDISLFVLLNQGEMIDQIPNNVKVLNSHFCAESVLSKEGKRTMKRYVFRTLFRRNSMWRNLPYLFSNLFGMLKKHRFLPDKLLWRVMSDGAPEYDETYDLAVAFLEGGSAYYVADHVKASKKVGFVHIDYQMAGYNRSLDQNCYDGFDRIYAVSDEVRERFLDVYPEFASKTEIFHNVIHPERIREQAALPGGFDDDYDGKRILTVGRLTAQKAYEVAIEAMSLLKETGANVRWYVLGEGEERRALERKIAQYGLEDDFLLLGAKDNPYPYYAQTDYYVHATRFEGKSIAIQEAQTLGCTILVSDSSGNREQIRDGIDGKMCALSPEGIRDGILGFLENPEECRRYGKEAAKKDLVEHEASERFYQLIIEET